MLKIDKGIPIPARRYAGRPKFFSFDGMKVGDSFFMHRGEGTVQGARRAASRNGIGLTIRALKDGYRIWRVK